LEHLRNKVLLASQISCVFFFEIFYWLGLWLRLFDPLSVKNK
jgi:hypothetical protein